MMLLLTSKANRMLDLVRQNIGNSQNPYRGIRHIQIKSVKVILIIETINSYKE